jgi:hypothetical protein
MQKQHQKTCVLFSFHRLRLNATEDIVSSRLFSCIVKSEQLNEGSDLHNKVDEQRSGLVKLLCIYVHEK